MPSPPPISEKEHAEITTYIQNAANHDEKVWNFKEKIQINYILKNILKSELTFDGSVIGIFLDIPSRQDWKMWVGVGNSDLVTTPYQLLLVLYAPSDTQLTPSADAPSDAQLTPSVDAQLNPSVPSDITLFSLKTDVGSIDFNSVDEVKFFGNLNTKCVSYEEKKEGSCLKFNGSQRITDEDMLTKVYQCLRQGDYDNFKIVNGFLDYNDRFKVNNQSDIIIEHLKTTLLKFENDMLTKPDIYTESKIESNTITTEQQFAIDAKKDLLRLTEINKSNQSTQQKTNPTLIIKLSKEIIGCILSNPVVKPHLSSGQRTLDTNSSNQDILTLSEVVNTKLPDKFKALAKSGSLSDFERVERDFTAPSARPIADLIVFLATGKVRQLQKEKDENDKSDAEMKKTREVFNYLINSFLNGNTANLNEDQMIRIVDYPDTFLELFTSSINGTNIQRAEALFENVNKSHLIQPQSFRYWIQYNRVPDVFYKNIRRRYPSIFYNKLFKSMKEKHQEKKDKTKEKNFLYKLSTQYPELYQVYLKEMNDDDVYQYSDLFLGIDGCRDEDQKNWDTCLQALNRPKQQQPQEQQSHSGVGGRRRFQSKKRFRHTKRSRSKKKKTARRRRW